MALWQCTMHVYLNPTIEGGRFLTPCAGSCCCGLLAFNCSNKDWLLWENTCIGSYGIQNNTCYIILLSHHHQYTIFKASCWLNNYLWHFNLLQLIFKTLFLWNLHIMDKDYFVQRLPCAIIELSFNFGKLPSMSMIIHNSLVMRL